MASENRQSYYIRTYGQNKRWTDGNFEGGNWKVWKNMKSDFWWKMTIYIICNRYTCCFEFPPPTPARPLYTISILRKYRRIFFRSWFIPDYTRWRAAATAATVYAVEANHSRRRRRRRRRRRWRGDVVFNVRLGVCLRSFPPYITLYDPYRTALAPPPRPRASPATRHRRRRNKNIICQKPPPPPPPRTENGRGARETSVFGREISRNSKVEERERDNTPYIIYIYTYIGGAQLYTVLHC